MKENQTPAFPTLIDHGVAGIQTFVGMTLRDYFATHFDVDVEEYPVLAEILMDRKAPDCADRFAYCEYWFEAQARIRYMKADAMLKARST